MLAIKLALEEWLEGTKTPFLVWTDHKNLEYIRTAVTLSYRPGSRNVKPNALPCQFQKDEPPVEPAPFYPCPAWWPPLPGTLRRESKPPLVTSCYSVLWVSSTIQWTDREGEPRNGDWPALSSASGLSPFQCAYGHEPSLFMYPR